MSRILSKFFILIIIFSLWYPASGFKETNVIRGTISETVKIGVLLPLSGTYSSLAYSVLNAITAAAFQINNSSEFTFNITLVVEDTQDLDSQAHQAYDMVKSQGVQLILGPMFSGPSELVAKQAQIDQIVQICFSATSSALSSPQYAYFFRTIPPDDLQSQALTALISNFNLHSVFIIHHDDDWANSLVTNFYDGSTLAIGNQSYNDKATDFPFLINEMIQEAQNYDAFLLVALVDDVKLLLPKIKQAGIENPLFGTEANAATDLMDDTNSSKYPAVLSGTLSHLFSPGDFGYDNFVNASIDCNYANVCLVNNSYIRGSNYDAYAYDALWIGAKAIQMGDSYQGFDIKSNMIKAGASYIGATGNKSFTENGDPNFSLFDIYQYQTRQFTMVGTWDTISGLLLNTNVIVVRTQSNQIVGVTDTTLTDVVNNSLFDIPGLFDSLVMSFLVGGSLFLVAIGLYIYQKKKKERNLSKIEKNTHLSGLQKIPTEKKPFISDETFTMLEEMIEETKK